MPACLFQPPRVLQYLIERLWARPECCCQSPSFCGSSLCSRRPANVDTLTTPSDDCALKIYGRALRFHLHIERISGFSTSFRTAADVLCTNARANNKTSIFESLMLPQAVAWLQLLHQRATGPAQRFHLHCAPGGLLRFASCSPITHCQARELSASFFAGLVLLQAGSRSHLFHQHGVSGSALLCASHASRASLLPRCAASYAAAKGQAQRYHLRYARLRLLRFASTQPNHALPGPQAQHFCLRGLDVVASRLLVAALSSTWSRALRCHLHRTPLGLLSFQGSGAAIHSALCAS